jgi:KDO2-lipid IV(A) lauroyltransferase
VSGRQPTLEDRLEFLAFRIVAALLRALPERWAIGLGGLLGWLAGVVLRVRRDVVDDNLARAFPERDADWRRRVALGSYRHLGAEAARTLRVTDRGPRSFYERAEVRGLNELVAALANGGVILVSGHVGNWELLSGALTSRGIPVDAVVASQRNPLFDAELARRRERLGVRVLPRGGARGEVLRSLEQRRVVLLAADQDAGAGGVFVDFLGSPASTARGPAVLALRSGARLFSVFCVADDATGGYRIAVDEIEVQRSGDLKADIVSATREHTRRLAAVVKEAPRQYFWQHKRWKTRPEPALEGPV